MGLSEAEATLEAFPGGAAQLDSTGAQLRTTLAAYVEAEEHCRAGRFQACWDTVQALWARFGQDRFDLSTWPERWPGVHEVDYYHGSINETLHPLAVSPLWEELVAQ